MPDKMDTPRADGWYWVQPKGGDRDWFAAWWDGERKQCVSGVGIYEIDILVQKIGPRIPSPDEQVPELPACAAIQFFDGVAIAGRRHDICIKSAVLCGRLIKDNAHIQGFMTNKGRFVDRQEAWDMAVSAGMVIDRPGVKILFSEDLY